MHQANRAAARVLVLIDRAVGTPALACSLRPEGPLTARAGFSGDCHGRGKSTVVDGLRGNAIGDAGTGRHHPGGARDSPISDLLRRHRLELVADRNALVASRAFC